MKILNYTEENFDFKTAMKENIKENFHPMLKENGFKKFSPIMYRRETDGVLQTIAFKLYVHRLEVYFENIPLFAPYAFRVLCDIYGSEVMWICSKHHEGKKVALERYNNRNISELKVLKEDLENFIIPGMERINSFEKLVLKIKNKKEGELVFGKTFTHNHCGEFTNGGAYDLEELIKIVYTCIYDDFKEGINQLKNFDLKIKDKFELNKENIFLEGLNETNSKLLFTNNNDITKEQFLENYEFVCEENRINYKLKKAEKRK